MLHLFCYGSLKPGERNHHVLAPWVVECRPAWVEGRLFLRETGYPALVAGRPEDRGTFDHEADLARTERNLQSDVQAEVPGSILTLSQGARVLHLLDDFEDFIPAGPGASEYERRLVLARDESGEVWRVWTYTATAEQSSAAWEPIEAWP